MLRFVFRKIAKSRWLVACLLIGGILASCVLSGVPMYTKAVMERMLTRDLTETQQSTGVYPGRFTVSWTSSPANGGEELLSRYRSAQSRVSQVVEEMGLPVQSQSLYRSVGFSYLTPSDTPVQQLPSSQRKAANLSAITDLPGHVQLVSGDFPGGQLTADGALEVMVTAAAAKKLDVLVGKSYYFQNKYWDKIQKVTVTGIFEPADPGELYWVYNLNSAESDLFMDEALFDQLYTDPGGEQGWVCRVFWNWALDYTAISADRFESLSQTIETFILNNRGSLGVECAARETLQTYSQRRDTLTGMLWVYQVPVVLMLLFYIVMVSGMIVGYEQNEMAVLKSRGASRGQVLRIYLYQTLLLALTAALVGPLLARWACQLIGSTNGFMEFVNRSALPVAFTGTAIACGAGAALVFCCAVLVPVLLHSTASVVEQKRKKHKVRQPFWKKFFLDFVLLAVALYGLYSYRKQERFTLAANLSADAIPMDPLLLVVSTAFILGVGLLFLRVYPLLMKLVFRLGRRVWSPVAYTGLLSVSKVGAREYFIMIFLIFTASLGVYNAISARALNQNQEDRLAYALGADFVFQEKWQGKEISLSGQDPSAAPTPAGVQDTLVLYTEPPFQKFREIEGLERVAKVFNKKSVTLSGLRETTQLLGVQPQEFAATAWSRAGLIHGRSLAAYMNLMSYDYRAVLVSDSLLEASGLKVGEEISFKWGQNGDYITAVIYGTVDYFPGWNPYLSNGRNHLIVANLDYLQKESLLEPYQVWAKMAQDGASAQVYRSIEEQDIRLSSIQDRSQQVIRMKNDAMLQGTNGSLTLSFLITILVTLIGYTIYWILSIKSRMLQFGILRSMGLSRLKLSLVLACEQLFISLVPMAAGFGIGTLAGRLYVPLIDLQVDPIDRIPPFTAALQGSDYLVLLISFGLMVAVGIGVLAGIVNRMKLAQVLKLGED